MALNDKQPNFVDSFFVRRRNRASRERGSTKPPTLSEESLTTRPSVPEVVREIRGRLSTAPSVTPFSEACHIGASIRLSSYSIEMSLPV